MLLAFDVFVLSEATRREISFGKIIHGDDHSALKVKTAALYGEVRHCIERIATLLSSPTPPDLVLNRHCGECEFQTRCWQIRVLTPATIFWPSRIPTARSSAILGIAQASNGCETGALRGSRVPVRGNLLTRSCPRRAKLIHWQMQCFVL